MKNNIKSYVISLSSATERRKHIVAEFSKKSLVFEFFDAVTPDTLKSATKQLGFSFDNGILSTGEVSCLLSHAKLWEKLLNSDEPYIAIFEDDIYLGKNIDKYLSSLDWIGNKDIIKIEMFSKKVMLSIFGKKLPFDERKIYQLKGLHLGCGGYIMSKKAAKQLLLTLRNRKEAIYVDHLLFDPNNCNINLTVFQTNPAMVIQDKIAQKNRFPSVLEENRSYKKEKINLGKKVKREILRLITQITYIFHTKKITYK